MRISRIVAVCSIVLSLFVLVAGASADPGARSLASTQGTAAPLSAALGLASCAAQPIGSDFLIVKASPALINTCSVSCSQAPCKGAAFNSSCGSGRLCLQLQKCAAGGWDCICD
jgi:hypothetical protein